MLFSVHRVRSCNHTSTRTQEAEQMLSESLQQLHTLGFSSLLAQHLAGTLYVLIFIIHAVRTCVLSRRRPPVTIVVVGVIV